MHQYLTLSISCISLVTSKQYLWLHGVVLARAVLEPGHVVRAFAQRHLDRRSGHHFARTPENEFGGHDNDMISQDDVQWPIINQRTCW